MCKVNEMWLDDKHHRSTFGKNNLENQKHFQVVYIKLPYMTCQNACFTAKLNWKILNRNQQASISVVNMKMKVIKHFDSSVRIVKKMKINANLNPWFNGIQLEFSINKNNEFWRYFSFTILSEFFLNLYQCSW